MNKIINNIATELNKANDKYTTEEYKYGLDIIINTLGTIVIVLAIALFFNTISSAATVLLCFALIRFFSGGYHFKTSIACIIGTTAIVYSIIIIDYLIKHLPIALFYLNIYSLIIFAICAPYKVDQVLKLKINLRFVFKIISLLIILTNLLIIDSSLATITFFIQSLTIIGLDRWWRN